MFGLPPATTSTQEPVVEVDRGLIPADFCRGNIFTCNPEDLPNLIHPSAGRCASLGLWLPFLNGNETVVLEGMDPAHPSFVIELPGERPEFSVPGLAPHPVEIRGELYLVCIDLLSRLLTLVWAGRTRPSVSPTREQLQQIESETEVRMKRS